MKHRGTFADWLPMADHLIDSGELVAMTTAEIEGLRDEKPGLRNWDGIYTMFGCRVVEIEEW